ncbi:TPA: restriction endonuclease subunit S [Escherichia coli]|jgi:type I restriction enzyme S subunit|uniref:Restriction endonuclease n=4 Tax=Enterobacterales TaxID=91347 RepID=A0A3W5RUB3_ECOLX|nr:restriction endonuclease subunit S [Escherichia coli]EBH3483112.1 restriction endonuclease [Salmonella enterica subsp. enterica serovar Haifa]ECK6745777.1 restriction endonuclease [Salmonella enterica]EEZ5633457.1 restriction endonuclease [Escherichia coli O25]EEZ9011499.1 restriction endonuclease [Escherichia coli O57:H16]EEZ9850707.1 restriction endonuclease [Escherichia coli O21]EFK01400.1 type I restriction modification DNA specificity domain protein [Escherichia coli MS 182-1]EFZ2922
MVSIESVAKVITGKTPPKADPNCFGGNIPFITPSELTDSDYLLKPETTLTEKGLATTKLIPKNSILVCCIGSLGKMAIADLPVATNQQINSVIFDDDKIYYRFGFYALKLLKNDLKKIAPSTTVAIINKSRFSELKIPCPPLEEQKRIATILDKADGIHKKREQAIKLADDFLRAKFLEMFGTPANNIHRFPKGTIRDLVDSVNYGTSAKASIDSGEYPILRMGNITYQGRWDFTDLKYLDLSVKEKDKYLVKEGDLLFNRTNSKELVGKTAVYEEDRPMAFAGYLIRVRPNSIGNNYYISGYLNSIHGKITLMNMCKSIVGMANINAQELQNIEILIPPKHLQDEYEIIYKKIKKGLSIYDKSAMQLQLLASNLSNKYFM